MIEKFLKIFDFEIDKNHLMKIINKYYLVNETLKKIVLKNKEKPKSIGIFLGETKGKKFNPSIALIEMISKKSDKKIFVDKKAEWLFLCGRDIMGQSVTKINVNKGIVLIQDENDNNLGLGKIIGKQETDKIFIKNIIDKGDFLRREK